MFAPRLSSLSFGSYVNLAAVTQVENKPHQKSQPPYTLSVCTYVASSFPFISFLSILFWILSKKNLPDMVLNVLIVLCNYYVDKRDF